MMEAAGVDAREVQKIMKDALACGLIEKLGTKRGLNGLYRLRYDRIDSTPPYEERALAAEQREKNAQLKLVRQAKSEASEANLRTLSSRNSPQVVENTLNDFPEPSPNPLIVFPGPRQPIFLSEALASEIGKTRRLTIVTQEPLTVRYGTDGGDFFISLTPHAAAAARSRVPLDEVKETLQPLAYTLFGHALTARQVGEVRTLLTGERALEILALHMAKKPKGNHSPGILFGPKGMIAVSNETAAAEGPREAGEVDEEGDEEDLARMRREVSARFLRDLEKEGRQP
jgi:hypothetical protein